MYYEDSDICLREWLLGGQVTLVEGVHWTHGWARETVRLKLRPWLLELRSAFTFYSRYPRLLGTDGMARRAFPQIASAMASPHETMLRPEGAQ